MRRRRSSNEDKRAQLTVFSIFDKGDLLLLWAPKGANSCLASLVNINLVQGGLQVVSPLLFKFDCIDCIDCVERWGMVLYTSVER